MISGSSCPPIALRRLKRTDTGAALIIYKDGRILLFSMRASRCTVTSAATHSEHLQLSLQTHQWNTCECRCTRPHINARCDRMVFTGSSFHPMHTHASFVCTVIDAVFIICVKNRVRWPEKTGVCFPCRGWQAVLHTREGNKRPSDGKRGARNVSSPLSTET